VTFLAPPPGQKAHVEGMQACWGAPCTSRKAARTVHERLGGGEWRADEPRVQVGQAAPGEVLHHAAVDAVEQAVDGEVAPAVARPVSGKGETQT